GDERDHGRALAPAPTARRGFSSTHPCGNVRPARGAVREGRGMERQRKEAFAEGLAAASLVLAPLALGMVHLPAVLAVSSLAWLSLAVLVTSRGREPLRIGWFGGALLALAFATALHLIPLPFAAIRLLSPETARILEITLGPDPGFRAL